MTNIFFARRACSLLIDFSLNYANKRRPSAPVRGHLRYLPVISLVAMGIAACGGSQGNKSSEEASKNGAAHAKVIAGAEESTALTVSAKGSKAIGVSPQMEIRVNGAVIERIDVNASEYQDYSFTVSPSIQAGDKIDVVFLNDDLIQEEDRNLWVESISFQNITLKSTAPDVVLDRGAIDGKDVLPGQEGLYWNGALRFTAPASAGSGTTTTAASESTSSSNVTAATTPTVKTENSSGSGGAPSPTQIGGKASSGAIIAIPGQVIENLHITTSQGPCIVVPNGAQGVIVRDNEIGPCGADANGVGVRINGQASNIQVERNVIHDVASGVYAEQAKHPLIIDRNFVYNVHGPMPRGQMVQFNQVSGGSGSSRITCNVSDNQYGSGNKAYEDHINIFNSSGTASEPIEIARNRIRGGSSNSGSGIMMGDYGGGNIWAHDNVLVYTANTGIGIAGGHNIRVENNRIDNRGSDANSKTGLVATVANWSPSATSCGDHRFSGNRGISRSWVWGGTGEVNQGFWTDGQCSNTSNDSNNWEDASLNPSMFDETVGGCS